MIIAKKYLSKYYWILLLGITIFGSWWLSIRAWDYLHAPIILDSFWSESLKMWEPVYAPEVPEWIHLLTLTPVIGLMWWYSPIWFQLIYTPCMLWFLLQVYIRVGAPQ